MVAKRRSPEDACEAVSLLLGTAETDGDFFGALDGIRPLHPANNTFRGEVFMRLAAGALGLGG